MRDVVIFDLDGTLALIDHRRHFVEQSPKDWDSFYAACDKDELNRPIAEQFYMCSDSAKDILIFSGRRDSERDKTMKWLKMHDLVPHELVMRKTGDFTPDHILKEKWLHDFQSRGYNVLFCYDDRSSVVDMWRRNGVTCLQVAPGDF